LAQGIIVVTSALTEITSLCYVKDSFFSGACGVLNLLGSDGDWVRSD